METQHKLDAVYAKWERKAQPGRPQPKGEEGVLRTQYNNLIATSQKAWNNRYAYTDDYPSSNQPRPLLAEQQIETEQQASPWQPATTIVQRPRCTY